MTIKRKIWITYGKGGDVEESLTPCVVCAYATEKLAAVAVAKSLGAKAELEAKLRATTNAVERREFLSSIEAAILNRKITGEEWYEAVDFIEAED